MGVSRKGASGWGERWNIGELVSVAVDVTDADSLSIGCAKNRSIDGTAVSDHLQRRGLSASGCKRLSCVVVRERE